MPGPGPRAVGTRIYRRTEPGRHRDGLLAPGAGGFVWACLRGASIPAQEAWDRLGRADRAPQGLREGNPNDSCAPGTALGPVAAPPRPDRLPDDLTTAVGHATAIRHDFLRRPPTLPDRTVHRTI